MSPINIKTPSTKEREESFFKKSTVKITDLTEKSNNNDDNSAISTTDETLRRILRYMEKYNDVLESKGKNDHLSIEWRLAARLMDRFFMLLYFLMTTVFTIVIVAVSMAPHYV